MSSTLHEFADGSYPRGSESGPKSPVPYRLLKPATVVANERYPLVLYLHGAGERGDNNLAQLKYLPLWMADQPLRSKFPCFLLATQCPPDTWWIDIDWSGPAPAMTDQISDRLAAVMGMLDAVLDQHPIDRNRIYLTGLSMGGFAVWDLALREPQRWAAALPICGGADATHAAKVAKLPIWCFHGALDEVVSVSYSQRMIEAIRAAGGAPRYTEYPDIAHDSWTPAYQQSEALDWLFSQRKASPSSTVIKDS